MTRCQKPLSVEASSKLVWSYGTFVVLVSFLYFFQDQVGAKYYRKQSYAVAITGIASPTPELGGGALEKLVLEIDIHIPISLVPLFFFFEA